MLQEIKKQQLLCGKHNMQVQCSKLKFKILNIAQINILVNFHNFEKDSEIKLKMEARMGTLAGCHISKSLCNMI